MAQVPISSGNYGFGKGMSQADFDMVCQTFPSFRGFPVRIERHYDIAQHLMYYFVRLGPAQSVTSTIYPHYEEPGAVLKLIEQALKMCYHEGAKHGLSGQTTQAYSGGATQAPNLPGAGIAGTKATHSQGTCRCCRATHVLRNNGICKQCEYKIVYGIYPASAGTQTKAIQQQQQLNRLIQQQYQQLLAPREETKLVSLQCEATVLGELKGYRFWRYNNKTGLLQSCSADHRWIPGGVEHGDTKSVKEHCGLYSYKDFNSAMKHAEETSFTPGGTVVGTVDLWGDVIEHEKGYRSEYAKIVDIAHAYGTAKNCVNEIRQRYCCT